MRIPLFRAGSDSAESFELVPSKIIGVGKNYRAHAAEMGSRQLPVQPLLFLKAPSALIADGETIVRPGGYDRVDYEAELGVVIGRRAHKVSAHDALEFVLGYTCVNDVTVRDLQKSDGQWTRAKGFDTFCPVGPCIRAGLDPTNLRVRSRLNGEPRQDGSTADLIFSVPVLIEFVTAVMTLEPGDIISTGTPAGVGPLRPGDRVEVEVAGIGVLSNPVAGDD